MSVGVDAATLACGAAKSGPRTDNTMTGSNMKQGLAERKPVRVVLAVLKILAALALALLVGKGAVMVTELII